MTGASNGGAWTAEEGRDPGKLAGTAGCELKITQQPSHTQNVVEKKKRKEETHRQVSCLAASVAGGRRRAAPFAGGQEGHQSRKGCGRKNLERLRLGFSFESGV